MGKSGAKYDFDKTKWFNQQYLRDLPNNEIAKELKVILIENGVDSEDDFIIKVSEQLKEEQYLLKTCGTKESIFLFLRKNMKKRF